MALRSRKPTTSIHLKEKILSNGFQAFRGDTFPVSARGDDHCLQHIRSKALRGLTRSQLEWRAPACHPERQRRISRAEDRDPSLTLRMTLGAGTCLYI